METLTIIFKSGKEILIDGYFDREEVKKLLSAFYTNSLNYNTQRYFLETKDAQQRLIINLGEIVCIYYTGTNEEIK